MNAYMDDTLEAAMMAKNFGVRFLIKIFAPRPEFGDDPYKWTNKVGELIDAPLGPYLLHPDDLHIFEPKVGDIMQVKWGEGQYEQSVFVLTEKTKREWDAGNKATGVECEIIQRDGKRFFNAKRL